MRIERDALGVPTVHAESRRDVAFATGFLHAQDRFFQMDLLRRRAAGELSELLGPPMLAEDRSLRLHRLRQRAEDALAASAPATRAILDAYAAGVTAGLGALGAPPFEYVALFAEPRPWQPVDCYLVLLTMFLQLDDEAGRLEAEARLLHERLPEPLFDFLLPPGTAWDAPMEGDPFTTPAPPGPEVIDLRVTGLATARTAPPSPSPARSRAAASNAWAVAGSHTADGAALLVDDMHLPLAVPNLWYRAVLSWPRPGGTGPPHRLVGVTLPGTPAMPVASNGAVAWGITNSMADTSDAILLDLDPGDPRRYRTAAGFQPFVSHREILRVRAGRDEVLEFDWTAWGPVVEDFEGRRMAVHWVAQEPEAVDFGLLDLETTTTIDEAVAVGHRSGSPALSAVFADADGRVAWSVIGRLPRRRGFEGRLPTPWSDGTLGWDGLLAPLAVPSIVDPPGGLVWTANNREVEGAGLARLGDGGYRLGARAHQIRDALLALEGATPEAMWGILLDDRALFLERWRQLLLAVLTPPTVQADPRRGELRQLLEEWDGRASVDAAAYRALRAFRILLLEEVFAALTAPCREVLPGYDYTQGFDQHEGPLWRLVTERPVHLLAPPYATWDEQLLAAADRVLDLYDPEGGTLRQRTWGERNTAAIRHPFSRILPWLGARLDMPPDPLPGGDYMPRVQDPDYGSTLRMVVSPGQEERSSLHLPGGQSGHPRSPFYRAGHDAWVRGEPLPLLPGPPLHTLHLEPGP